MRKESASKVFTGMFGWDKKTETPKEALKDGLRTVSRILYAAGGLHDKNLSVAYSTSKSENLLHGKIVYLDSDIVIKNRPGYDTYDMRNDVLIGAALVGANAKLTADADYYRYMRETDEEIQRVYEATEFRASDMRVENEAPGLVEYLDARADYYADPNLMQELQNAANMEQTYSSVACALLNNLLVHRSSADAVNMGVYNDAVNEALGRLERCADSEARHREAASTVNWFRETFDPEEEKQDEEPNDGQDDKDDKQEQGSCSQGGSGSSDGSGSPNDENSDSNDDQNEGQDEKDESDEKDDKSDGDNQGDENGESDGKSKDEPKDSEPKDESKDGKDSKKQNSQPPDLSSINEQFDKEFTMVAGNVESQTGQSKDVQSTIGQDSKDSPENAAVPIGDEQPCKGWGDEVEPASVAVAQVAIADATTYQMLKAEVLVGIRALVNKLSWTSQKPMMTEHGYRSGDLDEGALSNLFVSDDTPAVFQRTEILHRPEIAVGIMVDESGSMSGANIHAAQRTAIMLTEAFKQVSGTRVRVWGHTTGQHYYDECLILPYVTVENPTPYGLAKMKARGGNIDGAALWYAAQELVKYDSDAERRILFCISDGLPSGGQEDGVEYNRRKAEAARKMGVEVFGIGIMNAYTPQVGEKLFGKDAFCIFPDVESAGQVIGAFITRAVNRS